jgi:Uma2 family endonuclease
MRAVTYEMDPALLAERARLGHDKRDEMWDGVLHMVPPANFDHQWFGSRLFRVLVELADERGLLMTGETGFFREADDFRVPDWAVCRSDQAGRRGMEGAELVIEIRSPGDETMVKLPWYLDQGCREVLIVDRDTLVLELHTTAGVVEGARSDVLGCTFETVDGPAVHITWDGGEATIRHR